jgi:HSP20 family molecular chaperone IbpA
MYSEKKKKKRFLDLTDYKKYQYFKNEFNKVNLKEKSNSSGIQIIETDESYHFELKKPGYIKDDFNFYIYKKVLVVTTEKIKDERGSQIGDGTALKHSYCYPSAYFKMELNLPNDSNKDEFFYDYKDGILTFELRKSNI